MVHGHSLRGPPNEGGDVLSLCVGFWMFFFFFVCFVVAFGEFLDVLKKQMV